MDRFATRLLEWFADHGRKDLPWQHAIDPYRVWVSEIMLQQTQVTTVIPYFQRFMGRFPDVAALADAGLDDVLHHWTGLGYYARGRNLHAAARRVMAEFNGRFPDDPAVLAGLPGIGRSTAGAIAAIAFERRAAILDGNVKRVLARFHGVAGYPGDAAPQRVLWEHAEAHTPHRQVARYTQAIMDLGATLCTRTRPRCDACPLRQDCFARREGATAHYPERKPRRTKPVRAARLFMVTDSAGCCLLEQRPASGLWGGLWTPPQRSADTSVEALCDELRLPRSAVADSRFEAPFRHTFTHFHLDIEPVFVTLTAPANGVADGAGMCWYALAANAPRPALGFSAPAARLLATCGSGLQTAISSEASGD